VAAEIRQKLTPGVKICIAANNYYLSFMSDKEIKIAIIVVTPQVPPVYNPLPDEPAPSSNYAEGGNNNQSIPV
jgi:hypothetical protein